MQYCFADYVLDTHTYTLQRHGVPIRLRPKAFDVCCYLVTHRDRVISKDELIAQLWEGQYLSDATLESTIHEVRQALGDSRRAQHYIQTMRGRGYRFVAAVQEQGVTPPLPPPPTLPAVGPLVGRTHELTRLQECLAQAMAGQGQAVYLVGPPGLGTSRLLTAMCQQAQAHPITCVHVQGHPWGATLPYLPLRTLVRQQCQITAMDTPEVIQAQVERSLQAAGLAPESCSAPLLAMLGVSEGVQRLASLRPLTRHVRISAAVRQLILASSRQHPLLLALDNLHWLDACSQSWLAALVESLAEAPLLLLTAACQPDAVPFWMQRAPSAQLRLTPLAPPQSQELLNTWFAQAPLPEAVGQRLIAQAGGSPLFLEELAHWVTTPGAGESAEALPTTLSEVITRRLAQLSAPAQRLLHTAAVLGPAADWPLCQALWGEQETPTPLLAELTHQAFYMPANGFTHPLRWQVAYDSLSPTIRQALHGTAARLLAAQAEAGTLLGDDLRLSHQAHSTDEPLALQALHTMATQATAYGASVAALSAIHQALPHVAALPPAQQTPRRTALLLDQAETLLTLRRHQEAYALLRAGSPQDDALSGRWALVLSQAASALQAWDEAMAYAQTAADAASRSQDAHLQGRACTLLAMACYQREDPMPGLTYSQQALHLLADSADPEALGLAHLMHGFNAFLSGDMAVALDAVTAAERLAHAREEAPLQAYAAWLMGWIQATCGAWDESGTACQRSLAVAVEPLHTAFAQGWLGYARLGQGHPEMAQPLLEQALRQMHTVGYKRCAGLFTTVLAACQHRLGHLSAAQELAQQGLTLSRTTTHRLGIGWAQRLLSQLAHATAAPEASWRYGQEALATFAAIPARCEMGQTHLLLAELAQAQDRPELACQQVREAQRLLQPLHVGPLLARVARQAQALACPVPRPG